MHAVALDPGTARGEQVESAVARWLLDAHPELGVAARGILEEIASTTPGRAVAVGGSRVPRRGEVLHRGISPTVAAGLALAQGVIGVPGRVDVDYPTYAADTGVPLTVVPASVFAAHGAATAAPGSAAGTFLVTGPAAGVAEAAGSAGASIEYVDGGSARSIGRAIARACQAPRVAPHVIVVTEVQRVAAPRGSTFGMDPELVGTERLATSVVPTAATALVELGEELLAGPTVLVLDHPSAHASLDQLRELSPATWDLRRAAGASRMDRTRWNMRRRMVRAIAGAEL
ncbi:MAG: hypothetical protein JWM86_669 [Thermoleophilia bacterium]|nr:hypothetical protein [Thermoleophilia bacterium]